MEHWYRSSAAGSKPLYGFDTLEQAFNFPSQLNRTRERIYRGHNERGGARPAVGR
jgi:hypothetical protein